MHKRVFEKELGVQGAIAPEKFIPYEPASDEWLENANERILQKSVQM
jgi:hypothetical protein